MYHVNKKFSTITRLKIFHKIVKLCKTLSTIRIIIYPQTMKFCGYRLFKIIFPQKVGEGYNALYQGIEYFYPQL